MNDLYIVALGALAGGFVQGVSGFAFGLVAISVWVWFLDPRLIAMLAVFGAWLGQVSATVSGHIPFRPKALLPYMVGGLLGIPVGVWLLPTMNVAYFKLGLGGFLMLCCPAMLFVASHGRAVFPAVPGVSLLTGVLGGITGALGGVSGAIPALWCALQGYDKSLQRSIIQYFNLTILSVTLVVYAGSGYLDAQAFLYFLIVFAAVFTSATAGVLVYQKLDEAVFRKFVLILLTMTGVIMALSALLSE